MVTEIAKVQASERETLMNLLEKYQYEFSQWDKLDVDETGLYGYPYLHCYFEEAARHPYFIRVDGKLAGFVLVSDYPEAPGVPTDFTLSEMFVMHKYRRMGVGRAAVKQVLSRHHGKWQLKRHPGNIGSVRFWDEVIPLCTNGNWRLIKAYPDARADYDDGTPADMFFFET